MGFFKKLFRKVEEKNQTSSIKGTSGISVPEQPKKTDDYIESCFENKWKEQADNRWFSHFEELPEIDRLKKSGDLEAAIKLCMDGLKKYPDSFLFYGRAADIYDSLNQKENAIKILKEGLTKSLSKCSIAKNLAERAFKSNDYREAILWWIRAGVMQLESGIMVEYQPFLNLAYICQPIHLQKEEQWFLSLADRASSQGPIRFDQNGANLRHNLIQKALNEEDNEVVDSIKEFYNRYSNK